MRRSLSKVVTLCLALSALHLAVACGSDSASSPRAGLDDGTAGDGDANDANDAGSEASERDASGRDAASSDAGVDTGVGDGSLPDASASPCKTATCAVQIAVHNTHACALRGDGKVVCWGANGNGELGDGTTVTRNVPVVVQGLGAVSRLGNNAGSFSCALMRDATVKCWGGNGSGQLGDGTTTDRLTATTVKNLSGVEALYLGDYGACARLGGGQVKCWGGNNYGQLGTNAPFDDRLLPTDVPAFAGATQIDPAGLGTCALFANGTVKCVGYNGAGVLGDATQQDRTVPVVVSGLDDAKAITLGWYHACALRAGGLVSCWGRNGNGQLNDGTATDHFTPHQVPGLTGVLAIASGAYDVCVRRAAGAMCWASGTETSVAIAEPLEEVLPGNGSTCARSTSGNVYCWGGNDDGTLGDGTFTSRTAPAFVTGLH